MKLIFPIRSMASLFFARALFPSRSVFLVPSAQAIFQFMPFISLYILAPKYRKSVTLKTSSSHLLPLINGVRSVLTEIICSFL